MNSSSNLTEYHLLFSIIFLYLNLFCYIQDFETGTFKKAMFAHWLGLLALVWINLNSLKAISFKGKFSGCMRNVFYVRQLHILVIIFRFSFNGMHLDENNDHLSETKKCFLSPTRSQNEKIFAWYEKRFSHND